MALLLWSVIAPTSAAAQCPDGTPPPCARPARAPPAPAPNSVAVLYFDNLSRDTADAFLAEGITEELMGRLAEVRRLEVKPRSVSLSVRQQPATDLAALGRQTGAAYLVMGSVRRSGSRVRVTVELIRAATRTRAWTRTLDASGGDVLSVEEAIARDVVAGIAGELLPAERAVLARRPTRDNQAYEWYLRARSLVNRFTEPDLRAAITLFELAVGRDPRFALAYIGLGQAWQMLADDYVVPRVAYGQAQLALSRALAIDTSATALAWLVMPTAVLDYGAVRAESLARRAQALEPASADTRIAVTFIALVRGDLDRAAIEMRAAYESDTLSALPALFLMQTLAAAGRYDDLVALLPRAVLAVPAAEVGAYGGIVRFARGDCGGAVRLLQGGFQLFTRFYVVPALVCAGRSDEARMVRDSLLAVRERRYVAPSLIAVSLAALGDLDAAFYWLDRAYEERDAWPFFVRHLPFSASLRADRRWAAFARRVGMEP